MTTAERVNELLALVHGEGLDTILQRPDLNETDKQLLPLIATVVSAGKMPAVSEKAKGTSALPRPTAVFLPPGHYGIDIQNARFGKTFDEVHCFFKRTDGSLHHEYMTKVLPGSVRLFDLGNYAVMESYAIGAYIANQLVEQVPPDFDHGPMTPAWAAQLGAQIAPNHDAWIF